MRSEQDPDEYLYIMDTCRDRLNACDPPEGPTDRQYEDILLQALPPEYKAIRQVHLERGDFGLADIRRMMAAIYADNPARSCSDSFRGIAGHGAAIQAMTRDRNITCHFCGRIGHFVALVQMSDKNLGAVVSGQRTIFGVSVTQAAHFLMLLPWFGPGRNRR